MLSYRAVKLPVVQRFNPNGGVQIQVLANRLKGEATWSLHKHNSLCSRQLYKECDGKHLNDLRWRGGRRVMENALLGARSWGPGRVIQAAYLGQLSGERRWDSQCVSILPTSAESCCRSHHHHKVPSPFWEAASDSLRTRRFKRSGVIEPVLLMSGAGHFSLVFPITAMQTRASSTSAAQKRESGPEDTAHLKADQSLSEASGRDPEESKPSKTQQLKKVFKEYGAVGVTFHIAISLMSLGMFYLAVSSGIDMAAMLSKLGFNEAVVRSRMAAGTSTFVLAYAVHKLFAPVRISITLVSVPLIVRYFRKTGLFKPPTAEP
ncbi:hypothetical protein AAFF_G00391510 [Aldrovandia affinis]|uniref:DUF1279 domain-containing protein n=1 Tax=Aldrovandia affinis TaxID=143900 RepID=A0AAD7WL16_9TELE|nr:hypothetical protein AAFF_G00391510 [Aldrovandia affinis]